LTTKFTRHTAASPQLSAMSRQLPAKPPRAAKIFVGLVPALPKSISRPPASPPRSFRFETLKPSNFETCFFSAGSLSGTHKNLRRLVICPIYSVVKYRPRWLSPADLHSAGLNCSLATFAFNLKTKLIATHWSLQPNVRRQATFMNRERNHGCRV